MTGGQTWVVASLNSGFQIPDSLLGCLLEIESTSMRMQTCSWDAAASTLVPSTQGASPCFSRSVAIPIRFGVTGRGLRPWEDAGGQVASPSLPPLCILIFLLENDNSEGRR